MEVLSVDVDVVERKEAETNARYPVTCMKRTRRGQTRLKTAGHHDDVRHVRAAGPRNNHGLLPGLCRLRTSLFLPLATGEGGSMTAFNSWAVPAPVCQFVACDPSLLALDDSL